MLNKRKTGHISQPIANIYHVAEWNRSIILSHMPVNIIRSFPVVAQTLADLKNISRLLREGNDVFNVTYCPVLLSKLTSPNPVQLLRNFASPHYCFQSTGNH